MPLLVAWLLAVAPPESIRMGIFFAGQPAGESTFVLNADGTFASRLRATLGTTEISGSVEGRFSAERIVRYQAQSRLGNSTVDLAYVPGKLRAKLSGTDRTLDHTIGLDYAGSLHPQLTASFLNRLGKGMQPGSEKKSSVYLVDNGVEGPCVVRFRGKRAVGSHSARQFELIFGAVEIEYTLDEQGVVVAMDVPGQRLRFLVAGWGALFEDPSAKHPELSAPVARTETLKGLKMRLRDGVELIADVMRPVGKGPFPALVERTPYGRANALSTAGYWATRGYAYVAQDCRGRGDSGGTWDPFVNEGKDGYDAIEWTARQSWCDGKVGMIGGSYAGVGQWQAAVERPPSLRCIVPQVPPADAMRNLPYEYGTFYLDGALWWTHLVEKKRVDLAKDLGRLPRPEALTTLPLSNVDKAIFGKSNPIYQRWLRRTTIGDWPGYDHLDRLSEAQVPALHISGWLDGDGIGTKLNWGAMRRAGRKDQWLVYGPWSHAFNTTTRVEGEEFGPTARYDLDSLTLRFFDTYLKDKSVGMDEVPRVQAFVTGANRWVSLDGWPSSASPLETLYLAPNALQKSPGPGGASVYVYDPAKDRLPRIPVLVTKVVLPPKGTYALFRGAPLDRAEAVAGPFEVRLFFKSNAVDTDFFATLLDIAPGGTMRAIGQPGKLRASYRESLSAPTLLKPGRNHSALLRPWDEAHELAKGHRLGLLIDSSLFPMFARNLGTGESMATAKTSVPQRNAILCGTVTPSRITFRRLW